MTRGHIRSRAKGTWTLTIELPPDPMTGRRRQRYETYRGNKRDAQRRLSELQTQVDKGEHINPSRQTLGEFLQEWLDGEVATTTRPTTAQGYRWYVGKYINPRLGQVALRDLQSAHLQSLYASMLEAGLSTTTIAQAHRILRRALSQGVKQGLVARNAGDAVTPPRPERKEMGTMSPRDVQRFLDEAKDVAYYPVFVTLLWTGAHRSEVLALQWKDIDHLMGTISVNRAMHVLKGARLVFNEPKSAKGRRLIAMPPSLGLALAEHHEMMERVRGSLREDDLVFTWEDGRPMLPLSVSHAFRRIARRIGLQGVHLHTLRHTHASLMLKQGVHPKIVQERLGHSTVGITLDTYSHVTPGIQQVAAQAFDEVLADTLPVNGSVDKTQSVPLTNR